MSSSSSSNTKKHVSEHVNDDKLIATEASKKPAETSAAAAASEVSDSTGEGSKKAVWNKATNGAIESVMGAESWPALSDKVASVDAAAAADPPFIQGSAPFSPRKQATTNTHSNADQRNAHTTRQRSFKKHGGSASGNTSGGGGSSQPLLSPTSQNSSGFHRNVESAHKVEGQSQGGIDRPQHNNAHRKGTGSHQHGAKKDQDRPNRNYNNQGSFNGRDSHLQPTTGGSPRGVIRHYPVQHSPAMYAAHPLSPTMRPYGPPEFPMYYVPVSPESIRDMGMPYSVAAPHQMFMQYMDPELYSKVIKQIDYYFSNENLVKDIYLRNNMDEEGWVSIELIAGFKQVQKLTNNIAFIMEAIKTSTVVELKDNKVRRLNDWSKWLMPASLKVPLSPTHRDPGSPSTIVAQVQKINIDKGNADVPSASSQSVDPSSQNQGH